MHFIQFFVVIAFATFIAAAPVPPQGALSDAAVHNDVAPTTHAVHSLHFAAEPHDGPAPNSHLEKRGRSGKAGGKGRSCKTNSVWAEIKQANRFADPRETRGSRMAAGIASLVEWFKNGKKNPTC